MADARFTLVSHTTARFISMLIFVPAFATDVRGRTGTYPRAATPSRVPPPTRLWGAWGTGARIKRSCAVQTAFSVMAGLDPAIHAAPLPANPKAFRRLDDVAECACIRLR